MILAIDPGNTESAYVLLDDNLRPIDFGKMHNQVMILKINHIFEEHFLVDTAIEMIASYGMPVGAEVFETCVWIGRFIENVNIYHNGFGRNSANIKLIYRKDEKMNLCGTMKAKDSNIIQALKDRFGDKGTKKAPGWFYGFSKDIWQAYAVGVTYSDMYLKGEEK